jgi:energy-coupling factor transporter ATP-binding protein EcfA2
MSYEKEVSPLLPADESSFESKYEYANAYKEVGNKLFKDGKFEWAIRTYSDAVEALLKVDFENQAAMFRDSKASTICCQCLSNAAMCSLKMEAHDTAISFCNRALQYPSTGEDKAKVHFRKGKAHMSLGEPKQAAVAFAQAMKEDPKDSIKKEMLKAKRAVKAEQEDAENKVFIPADYAEPNTRDGLCLEVNGVKFSYPEQPVLRGVTLRLYAGQILGVMGRNECGKTTLSRIILRKLMPDTGTVTDHRAKNADSKINKQAPPAWVGWSWGLLVFYVLALLGLIGLAFVYPTVPMFFDLLRSVDLLSALSLPTLVLVVLLVEGWLRSTTSQKLETAYRADIGYMSSEDSPGMHLPNKQPVEEAMMELAPGYVKVGASSSAMLVVVVLC